MAKKKEKKKLTWSGKKHRFEEGDRVQILGLTDFTESYEGQQGTVIELDTSYGEGHAMYGVRIDGNKHDTGFSDWEVMGADDEYPDDLDPYYDFAEKMGSRRRGYPRKQEVRQIVLDEVKKLDEMPPTLDFKELEDLADRIALGKSHQRWCDRRPMSAREITATSREAVQTILREHGAEPKKKRARRKKTTKKRTKKKAKKRKAKRKAKKK